MAEDKVREIEDRIADLKAQLEKLEYELERVKSRERQADARQDGLRLAFSKANKEGG